MRGDFHIGVDAMLLKSENTGTGFYTFNLLRALGRSPELRGARITAFVPAGLRGTEALRAPEIALAPVPIRGALSRVAWQQFTLPRELTRRGVDLLLCPFFTQPLRTRVPTLITIHDLFHEVVPDTIPLARRLYLRAFVAASARAATGVIAVSRQTRADLIRHYGTPGSRVRVIHEAAGHQFVRPDPDAIAEVVRRHRIHQPFALAVGSQDRRKNFAQAIRALEVVDGLELIIAGGVGNDSAALRALVAGRGLEPRVRFLGYVPDRDLAALYRSATAAVIPSLYEGFGLPAVEAFSAGTPVIAAARGALPEVVSDAGLLYRDDGELAACLRRLRDDPSLRDRLAERGRRRAASFSWERAARETLAFAREVAAWSPQRTDRNRHRRPAPTGARARSPRPERSAPVVHGAERA
jgi:glycosyltransferase involved in cell wall biosynthesis